MNMVLQVLSSEARIKIRLENVQTRTSNNLE